MGDREKRKATAETNSEKQEKMSSSSGSGGNQDKQCEEAEYVIDEYWDEKFGCSFGILDWSSLGIGG